MDNSFQLEKYALFDFESGPSSALHYPKPLIQNNWISELSLALQKQCSPTALGYAHTSCGSDLSYLSFVNRQMAERRTTF